MKNHRIFFKKIYSKNGFSLTEVLTTIIIMSLFGIMVTTGIVTSARVYKEITEYSNAQLMLSNTITALHDELIYALPETLDIDGDDVISFEHVKTGIETIKFDTDGDKGIYISYGEGSSAFYPLVSYQNKESLYNKWTVADKGNGIIEVSVVVCKSDGTELIKVKNYDIELLNG